MKPGRQWLILLCWLAFLGLMGGWAASSIAVKTDLSLFLPQGATPGQRLLVEQLRDGPASRLILIGLEGADAAALAETSKRLAATLRKSGDFSYVQNGEQLWGTRERELLFQNRYLLGAQTQASRFTAQALHEALQTQLNNLASALAPFIKNTVAADPTGEFLAMAQSWFMQEGPQRHHNVWFSPDHQRALLIAATKPPGFDMDAQRHIIERVRQAFSVAKSSPDARLVMSGPALFALDASTTIRNEATQLSLIATLLVIAFLYLSLRSNRLIILSILPVATGMLAGIAAVTLVFGFIHGITFAFGITLIGVAIDYPIHLFAHLRSNTSAIVTMRHIWPTLRLGIITTTIGFGALLFSGFQGLSQLGTFATAGLLAAAAATRWLLPPLTPADVAQDMNKPWPAFDPMMNALQRIKYAPLLAGFAALLYLNGSGVSLWEEDIASLSPITEEDKRLDEQLRNQLGAPNVREIIVIRAKNEQDALMFSERLIPHLQRLVAQRDIAGYDMAARYLPSQAQQLMRRNTLPDDATLRAALGTALTGLPFKPGVFEPFLFDVAAAKNASPIEHAQLNGTSLGMRLDTLLFQRGNDWIALIPLRGSIAPENITGMLDQLHNPAISFLDLKAESNRMVNAYRAEGFLLFQWGVLAIFFVLAAGSRSLLSPIRLMLPIASAILVTVATLHGLGERLSLFHLISLLLVLGLGLDYSLFFSRKNHDTTEHEHTLRSLIICATTTMIGFGCLAFSHTPVLKAIGVTTALGTALSLLFAATLTTTHTRKGHNEAEIG